MLYVAGGMLAHVTCTFDTAPPATVPLPLATLQVWLAGCVRTVTAYVPPSAIWVAKLKLPSAFSVASSPPLFCSTSVPLSPLTLPPTA